MRGIVLKIIPIVVLLFFTLVMTTGALLKKPMFDGDDVMEYIEQLEENVQQGDWRGAEESLKKAKKAWKKVVARIQYSTERSEINELKTNLERTQGYIRAEDKSGVFAELEEAKFIWTELGK